MRKRIFILSIILFVVSIFVASEVFAKCRPGFREVTLINPAGKVRNICIPDKAFDLIGGPGDVIIQVTCPCWSVTSIDQHVSYLPDRTCAQWVEDDEIFAYISRDDPPPLFSAFLDWWEPFQPGRCSFFDAAYGIQVPPVEVSYDEARVCYEILVNSEMWAANNCM